MDKFGFFSKFENYPEICHAKYDFRDFPISS